MNDTKNSSFIEKIKSKFDKDSQIAETSLTILGDEIYLFYIDSLIDKTLFSGAILAPIERLSQRLENDDIGELKKRKFNQKTNEKSMKNSKKSAKKLNKPGILDQIKKEIVSISAIEDMESVKDALQKLLSGNVIIASKQKAISCPAYGLQARSVQEPPTERVVKGPREGFVEDLPRNLGLIRKRLKTTDLKIKDLYVGKQTNTHIAIVYIDGIAKSDIVKEVEKRINAIDIDAIIDSYYIESFLETNKIKFFRRVGNTEKPDILCSKILEGRVAILVDGSPIALTVPFTLFEDLQSPEDYYTIPAQATFVRIMRIVGLIFAILIPGIYVALQSFNYRILPINFLITLLSSIEGLSVPPLVELLLVLFLFEIITEASLQMPNALSMALSIIGALALGNTAVDAGIISPPSIVIVAISSVALYIIPDQIAETRLLRVLFTTIGGIIGLYGIITSFIILTTYLTSIRSFGVPYLSPIAPFVRNDTKDSFFKQSVQNMDTRPVLIAGENKIRQTDFDETDLKTHGELMPNQKLEEKLTKGKQKQSKQTRTNENRQNTNNIKKEIENSEKTLQKLTKNKENQNKSKGD